MAAATITTDAHPAVLLKQLNKEFPRYTLKDKVLLGKVCDIYDGDTVDVILYLPDDKSFKRYRIKMHGYNSPEIRPRSGTPNRQHIRGRALESLEALWKYATNTELFTYHHDTLVRVECGEWDKYGRVIAKIYRIHGGDLDDIDFCVNDAMIQNAFGLPLNSSSSSK